MAGIKWQNYKQISRLLAAIFAACASSASSARSDAAPSAVTPITAPTESLLRCPFRWPEAPQSSVAGDPLSTARLYGDLNPVPLQQDSSSNVRLDSFQSLTPSTLVNGYKGVFVYAPSSIFIFRALGAAGTFNVQSMDTALYGAFDLSNRITNPKFSPNGRYISYDAGNKDLYSTFNIMVWDIIGKRVIKVASDEKSVLQADCRWSPDGEKIAYLFGGEFNKEDDDLGLMIFDVAQRQGKFVDNVTVSQGAYTYFGLKQFSWLNKDEILYSKTDRTRAPRMKNTPINPQNWEPEFPHSTIHKINIQTRDSIKLIDDAFAPHPSPDGKWIAFLGWPRQTSASQKPVSQTKQATKSKPTEKQVRAIPLNLYLFNTTTRNVTPVDGIKIGVADQTWLRDLSLVWTPDSSSLAAALFFEESVRSPDDTYTLYQTRSAKIQTIDLPKEPSQTPATHLLQEMKFEGFHPHWWKPFAFHSILKDNRTAFLIRRSLSINEQKRNDDEVDLLLALDLQTGAISNVAKFSFDINHMDGWDWAECAP